MGRSVLAYQFVAGLSNHLKAKLVGREGTFEELLAKARFEEARVKELSQEKKHTQQTNPPPTTRKNPNPTGPRNSGSGGSTNSPYCCSPC